MQIVIDIPEEIYEIAKQDKWKWPADDVYNAIKNGTPLDKIIADIEQLPTKTRTNWDGCCPDIDYPEIEYVDVTKNTLLSIIDKYKVGSEVVVI